MSEKSCSAWSSQYLKKYQKGKATSNIYTFAWDWSDTVFDIKSNWCISFECPYPVIFSRFRIFTIYLKSYGDIPRKPL